MRNVEIKAKIHNLDQILDLAKVLSGSPGTTIHQNDTFYKVPNGRLKMRLYADNAATLVRYDRDDTEGPKMSDYDLLHFSSSEEEKTKMLDSILTKTVGIRGRVVKERKLFMVGQTRIHIDTVQDLGNFMELEVVLQPEQTLEEGQTIARDLQSALGVRNEDLIDCAYMDMIEKKSCS